MMKINPMNDRNVENESGQLVASEVDMDARVDIITTSCYTCKCATCV